MAANNTLHGCTTLSDHRIKIMMELLITQVLRQHGAAPKNLVIIKKSTGEVVA
jgi:hypothetical protein